MLQNAGSFVHFDCKCASRHSGVPFLAIGTSKSGPRVWCFTHFDLQMVRATAACNFSTSELQKVLRHRQFLSVLTNVLRATAACHFSGSQLQKVARECGVLHILTYKWASRHSGVQFFRIETSKIGPSLVSVLQHFDLTNVLRATAACHFSGSQLQNGSAIVVFCAFWLTNVLRATAACNFWTSELPKLVRDCGVLCILTWKCASRHSGVPFFTCLLNRYLRTRRFSEATFRTSGTTNHWKNTAILGVANISRTCSFFLVTLHACGSSFYWLYTRVDLLSADLTSLLCFSTLLTWHLYSAFQLCILSEVRLLNFLRLKSS